MLKVLVYSPKGLEIENDYSSVEVMDNKHGSFGILTGHVPVISVISKGYIKLTNEKSIYVSLTGAILKHCDNVIKVITENLAIGDSIEESTSLLEKSIKTRINENKKRNVELALQENELKKEIKKTGAGRL